MKVGYVAGPFRGKDHWEIAENIRNAERLALEVWRLGGAAVICPHANTAHYQDAAPDHIWLDGDLEMLARCDFVIMTPDWRRSKGATAEHDFAVERGIPVFFDLPTLEQWLNAPTFAIRESRTDVCGVVMDAGE